MLEPRVDVLSYAAACRLVQPRDQAHQRRLAAAVFAEEHDSASLGDAERHTVQNAPVLDRKCDVVQLDQRLRPGELAAPVRDLCGLPDEVFAHVLHLLDRLAPDVPNFIDIRQHHVESVFDDDHAIPRMRKRAKRAHQHRRAVLVEVGERLVENDDLLPHRERARGDQSLFLPSRKRAAPPTLVQLHQPADDVDLPLHPVLRIREIFAPERDLVLDDLLHDLLVGVLQHQPDFAANVAEFFALDVLAGDPHFARQFAVIAVGDDAADDVHQRALALARMSRQQRHLAVFRDKVRPFEYLCLAVVRKVYAFQFYRVHKTTVSAAPTASPITNSTSESAGYSFL